MLRRRPPLALSSVALACSGAIALAADSENVTLLGTVAWSSWHSVLWGYADGAGNEFAIVGGYSEVTFYDATDR